MGDKKLVKPNNGHVEIEIPYEFLIVDFSDLICAIVESTYSNLVQQYKNEAFLKSWAILSSNIDIVDQINDYVLSLILGNEREYIGLDSFDMSDAIDSAPLKAITFEFLNTLNTSGLLNHRIKLKTDSPIMLLRNLDQLEGLCNGTRLIVTRLTNHVIKAKIIYGKTLKI